MRQPLNNRMASDRHSLVLEHTDMPEMAFRRLCLSNKVIRHFGFEDGVSAGYLGLCIAAARYDASRGCTFRTFAWWWVDSIIRKEAYLNRSRVKFARVPKTTLRHIKSIRQDMLLTCKPERSYVIEPALLRSLDDFQRDILTKKMVLDMTYEEIAEEYLVSGSYISEMARRALKQLKEIVSNDNA